MRVGVSVSERVRVSVSESLRVGVSGECASESGRVSVSECGCE